MCIRDSSYTVMAVVYPLNPVTQLPDQQGAGGKFSLNFILPADCLLYTSSGSCLSVLPLRWP